MIIPLYLGRVFVRQFSSKSHFIAQTMLLNTATRHNNNTIINKYGTALAIWLMDCDLRKYVFSCLINTLAYHMLTMVQ